MKKYKIGDWVIFTDKDWNERWKENTGISLYGKIAKIIAVNNWVNYDSYLLEFKEFINATPKGIGKKGHCLWCKKYEIKLAINHYKFKKWIKG